MKESLALKKLKGIKPKGVKPRLENTDLEKLLSLGNYFIDQRSGHFHSRYLDVDKKYLRKFNKEFDILIKELELSNDLLTGVINASYQNVSGRDAFVNGIYSGFLLTELTKRKNKENKLSLFYFNGQGNNFPNLFYRAKRVDVLIVDDVKGDDVCYELGYTGGKLGLVAGVNLEGEHIFNSLNFHQAGCKAFFAYNVKGDFSANNLVLGPSEFHGYFHSKSNFVFVPRRKDYPHRLFYDDLDNLNKSKEELDQLSSDELFKLFNPKDTQVKVWYEARAGKMFDLLRNLSKNPDQLQSNLRSIALMSQNYEVKRTYEY
ncbi:hypothetical protein HOK51_07870 [Candidatus Woesearchaeota archaeon]|jgi:hypothetical protein|nr:hypothetical protein [Candidatus Woesearchaeota archaeon]MBT6519742.1 hypothetical protein [Candidatus Woesearchaeota archaeon]MBT7368122.1 hypothetical protein [Candidatus Woesearchaeota archaeon]